MAEKLYSWTGWLRNCAVEGGKEYKRRRETRGGGHYGISAHSLSLSFVESSSFLRVSCVEALSLLSSHFRISSPIQIISHRYRREEKSQASSREQPGHRQERHSVEKSSIERSLRVESRPSGSLPTYVPQFPGTPSLASRDFPSPFNYLPTGPGSPPEQSDDSSTRFSYLIRAWQVSLLLTHG